MAESFSYSWVENCHLDFLRFEEKWEFVEFQKVDEREILVTFDKFERDSGPLVQCALWARVRQVALFAFLSIVWLTVEPRAAGRPVAGSSPKRIRISSKSKLLVNF